MALWLHFYITFWLIFARSFMTIIRKHSEFISIYHQPSKHLSSWRRLEDVFRLCLQKTSSRHFQNDLIETSIFALVICLQDIFKTAVKTYSRRLQNVFRTSSDVFRTFWGRRQKVFKTSSRSLAKMSSRRFQDVTSG